MALAEIYIPASRHGFDLFNAGIKICGIADANINPVTTVAGSGTTSLQGMFTLLAPTNYKDLGRQIGDAMVSMKDAGILTDMTVGTADTVTNLRNLFIGANSALAGTAYTHFAFPA